MDLEKLFYNLSSLLYRTPYAVICTFVLLSIFFFRSELKSLAGIWKIYFVCPELKPRYQRQPSSSTFSFVTESDEMDNFIESLIALCQNTLVCENVFVSLVRKEGKDIILSSGKYNAYVDVLQSMCKYVLANQRTIKMDDSSTDDFFKNDICTTNKLTTQWRSIISTPIFSNTGAIQGVISAVNRKSPSNEKSSFSFFDEELLKAAAVTIGRALSKSDACNEAIRASRKASALLSIVRARTSDQSIENILNITIEAAYDLLLPERVTVYLCDHRKEEAWICVSKDNIEGLAVRFGQGVAGTVAATGKTIRVENAYEDPRFLPDVDLSTGFKTKSMLCAAVPGFGTGSKPVAVIQLMNKSDNHNFDEEDEAALTDFCEEVSLAFRHKMLEISLLKVARNLREDAEQEKYNSARLEESLLREYSCVAQRYRYCGLRGPRSSLFVADINSNNNNIISGDGCVVSTSGGGSGSGGWSFPGSPRSLPPALQPFIVNTFRVRTSSSQHKLIHEDLDRWDLDPFEIGESDLMLYAEEIFASYDIITTFKVELIKLKSFIMAVHAGYLSTNTFHNFRHGWSVMHMTYQILRHGAARYFTSLEIFAILVCSLCHDLDHPGVSNAFEVASWSDLSLMHGDDAVLERHHVAMTLKLLCVSDNDILENLSPQEKLEMRRLLYSGIMATDMARHFDHVEQLTASGKKGLIDVSDAVARRTFLGNVVHCADLSGQALKLELALKWGDGLLQEFQAQARKEEELKIPVTPFMQGLENELTAMQLQLGFVSNIVVPLWNALSDLLPEVQHMAMQAGENKEYYSERIKILSASTDEPSKKGEAGTSR